MDVLRKNLDQNISGFLLPCKEPGGLEDVQNLLKHRYSLNRYLEIVYLGREGRGRGSRLLREYGKVCGQLQYTVLLTYLLIWVQKYHLIIRFAYQRSFKYRSCRQLLVTYFSDGKLIPDGRGLG
jgi:hypothetical protein